MGVGRFDQMVEAVARGVDMFDCVLPTRVARNGNAYTRRGRFPIRNAKYKADARPIEEDCTCYACRKFTRAYIRHLFNADEIFGIRLLTAHNLHCYRQFMRDMRAAIREGTFPAFRAEVRDRFRPVRADEDTE
jgi:queuine tRNA-ribosyltransferase